MKVQLVALALGAALSMPALAADQVEKAPPSGAYKKVSELVKLPNETFSVTLTVEGVYDYFCIPHEHAGMVGRIIVGRPAGPRVQPLEGAVPEPARRAFPSIEEIMRRGVVHSA